MKNLKLRWHYGHPVLVEPDPLTVWQTPPGAPLHESILLHPRYAVKNIPGRRIKVNGRIRGRTIEILLDEPVLAEKEEYHVLSLKGVGADAHKRLFIHPTLWYQQEKPHWTVAKQYVSENRRWGAVMEEDGAEEYHNYALFKRLGLTLTPYIALNNMPKEMVGKICDVAAQDLQTQTITTHDLSLCQVVRALHTNIRIDELLLRTCTTTKSYEEIRHYANIKSIAKADAILYSSIRKLAQKGRFLCMNGTVHENRFIDGKMTDAENYALSNSPRQGFTFLQQYFFWSQNFLTSGSGKYLRLLEEHTGEPFSKAVNCHQLDNILSAGLGLGADNLGHC